MDLIDEPDPVDALLAEAIEAAAKRVAELPSPSLDPLCEAIVAEVPESVASALVSLEDGALLGHASTVPFPTAFVEQLAIQTRQMFRGPAIEKIEATVRAQRGLDEPLEPYIREITMVTKHTSHFAKAVGAGRVALVIVASKHADRDKIWKRIHELSEGIEANLT